MANRLSIKAHRIKLLGCKQLEKIEDTMKPFIVADIGGTFARFGIARLDNADTRTTSSSSNISIDFQSTLSCADFSTFTECAKHYLSSIPTAPIQNGCFAFAAPITSDEITLTNNHWHVQLSEVKTALGLKRIEAINDFAAQACAIPILNQSELTEIKPGNVLTDANKIILGPGTGLGVGSLVCCKGIWYPVAGEGGHVGFSYPRILGYELLTAIQEKQDYLSLEMLLSGSGLVSIYKSLCKINNVEAKNYHDKDITGLGFDNTDPLCQKTLQLLCELLGAVAGDLALINGGKGGVYLTGGILPRIKDTLTTSHFVSQFNQKGKMSPFLNDIPVYLVQKNNPALYGAANWFLNNS